MPRIHPITLHLAPKQLEASFWREYGTPAYALTDRWSLILTVFNMVGSMLSLKRMDSRNALGVQLSFGAMIAVAVAARTLLGVAPDRYHAWRDIIVLVQRATRSALLLGGIALLTQEGWLAQLMKCSEGELSRACALDSPGLSHVLPLHATWMAMHTLVFSVRLSWAAPIQLFSCAAFCCWTCRNLACLALADAEVAEVARRWCLGAQKAKQGVMMLLGPPLMLLPEAPQVCRAAPMELLLPLFCALPCFLSLYILYERELSLKLQYLRGRGHDCVDTMPLQAISPLPRYLIAGPVIYLASVAVAEAAARFGRPVSC